MALTCKECGNAGVVCTCRKQFKMKIVDESTDTALDFVVHYAEEGTHNWEGLERYPSRIEAEAFIDGFACAEGVF